MKKIDEHPCKFQRFLLRGGVRERLGASEVPLRTSTWRLGASEMPLWTSTWRAGGGLAKRFVRLAARDASGSMRSGNCSATLPKPPRAMWPAVPSRSRSARSAGVRPSFGSEDEGSMWLSSCRQDVPRQTAPLPRRVRLRLHVQAHRHPSAVCDEDGLDRGDGTPRPNPNPNPSLTLTLTPNP